MRILGEIALLILGIAAIMVIARGLTPVAPALAGFLRALFHPFVLVLLAALFVLFRLGRSRHPKPDSPPPEPEPPREQL